MRIIERMRAFVTLRLPDDELVELGHGDLIGRVASAQLCIDDPRVSEAHALLSLRRGEFQLLSLRRQVLVRDKPLAEVVLHAGMEFELAVGLRLRVEHVQRPAQVLAIEARGIGRRTLPGASSLHLGATPHLAPRYEADAPLHVWWNGGAWRARVAGHHDVEVDAGSSLRVLDEDVKFLLVEVEGATTTPHFAGAIETPLRIVSWYDAIEIHRAGRVPLTFSGVGARILAELIAIEGPADWHVVAAEVWRETSASPELRHRWDVSVGRVRARLKAAGVRDLVRSDGSGLVQLVRRPDDVIEDRS